MITNDRQLQNARQKLGQFRSAVASFDGVGLDPVIAKAQKDALLQQVKELDNLIREYEDLKEGRVSAFELDRLADLPIGLIKARIASNLTQRELAERLGLKEQQIQRYEADLYKSCSFARLVEVADALRVNVRERIEIEDLSGGSVDDIVRRLNNIGLDTAFLESRIDRDMKSAAGSGEKLLSRTALLFDWPPAQLRGDKIPEPPGLGVAMARFKMPRGRDARSVAAYTAYAHKLASICAAASSDLPQRPIPMDWKSFRASVLASYGTFDLKSVTHHAWDCGVVVLPLNDSGAFYGATWRFKARNVVVLKQRTDFPSRWLSDLVHELYHAGEEPDKAEFEVIELPETSEERRQSTSEQYAIRFSSEAILDGRAESLTQQCVTMAKGRVQLLKDVVRQVARRENVSQGVLANYLAFRLSLQGINWWGTATNLQDDLSSPLTLVRDIFFERFNFERLSNDEYDILSLALNDGGSNG